MTSSPVARSKAEWFAAYSKMLLARMCEEKIREEYFKDEMKTPVHLGIGGEAIACGVHASIARVRGAQAVKSNTKYFGTYRNHSIFLATSDDTDTFFGEMYGKVTGCGKGKAGSMHMASPEHGLVATSAVVGTTIPLAVGSALGDAVMGEQLHGVGAGRHRPVGVVEAVPQPGLRAGRVGPAAEARADERS